MCRILTSPLRRRGESWRFEVRSPLSFAHPAKNGGSDNKHQS